MRPAFLFAALAVLGCSKSKRDPARPPPVVAAPVPAVIDAAPPAQTTRFAIVSQPPILLALVPADAATGEFGAGPFGPGAVTHFTPTRDQAVRGWTALQGFLEQHPPRESPQLAQKYKGYKSQWLGLTVNGRSTLFANFFCSEEKGWQDHAVVVDDGGDCFFQIVFDLATGGFEQLMINGRG